MRRGLAALLAALAWPAAAADHDAAYLRESRERLKALVRLDTSNPPGNEILAASYLKAELGREGIRSEIFLSSPTRASLLARLPGSGEKRPILLMCHTDVVPASPEGWSVPPFAAVEKDGYLYGRGAADIKSLCAVEASLLVWLKRTNTRLSRDVVFLAEADEETGSRERHIDALLRERGQALSAEYGINEGGNIFWTAEGPTEIRVQAAEKEYMDIVLTARGSAGHASVPRPDNPVVALAKAVARLSEHRFPARIDGVVRQFLARQAPSAATELSAAIAAVLSASPGEELDKACDHLAALDPGLGAMLRDTLTPTVLDAGSKSNVIPSSAKATLNARLLPNRRAEELVSEIRSVIADPSIEIAYEPPSRAPVAAMPIDTELFAAIRSAASQLAPKARVLPFMSAWTTDSPDLRARGTIVYGLDPPVAAEDGGRIHGVDERLALKALDWYALFLRAIVLKVASPARGPAQNAK